VQENRTPNGIVHHCVRDNGVSSRTRAPRASPSSLEQCGQRIALVGYWGKV
jgi:hypothetical protein